MKVIYEDMEYLAEKHLTCFSQLENKRILITGSTGMIMSYMSEFLVRLNKKYKLNMIIYLQGRNKEKLYKKHRAICLEENVFLVDFDILNKIPDDISFDYIVHGASPAATKYFLEQPVDTILPNVNGLMNMLNYAKNVNSGGTKVVFCSSNVIYGKVNSAAITENDYGIIDILGERSCYVESKRMGEQLCVAYHRQYGIFANIVRVPYTYGPTYDLEIDQRAIPRFMQCLLDNKDVEMFQDNTVIQYTYVGDVICGILYALLYGKPGSQGAYNICSENNINMYEFVDLMRKNCLNTSKIIIKEENYFIKNKELNFTTIDNEKLKKLGWKEEYDYSLGIKQMMNGISERYNNEY